MGLKHPTSQHGGTRSVKASHTLNRLCPAFDDPNLVANAGLILPVTLAHRLGLPELLRTIDLGPVPGRPNPDTKAMTVISALLAVSSTSMTLTCCAAARATRWWATGSPRPQPWGRFSEASAGAMSASSTR